ncbi:MAG: winged helix-turn-helix domain-containing protein [Deltaproteobacteria bacterium]|nr:winged helix-turn-helix domain-containing protein [Deltaproteobacteria bacterium]
MPKSQHFGKSKRNNKHIKFIFGITRPSEKWKNKTAWAREYLKRKKQLDGSERGIWKITEIGKERIQNFDKTKKEPDEGLAPLQGVEVSISDEDITPQEGFNRIENVQIHETGGILGVRGIVYESINEQGVFFCSPLFAMNWDL